MDIGNLFLLFAGAILTFLGTATVEWQKDKRGDRRQQQRYSLYARLQLNSVLKVLDKLKHSYENGGSYSQLQRDIQLLDRAIVPLNNVLNDTTILADGESQEKLVELIADLNLYMSDISPLLATSADPDASVTGNDKLLTKHIELIDLRRRIEELIIPLTKSSKSK